ncbi:hypothetical protein ACQPU1_02255 [Clostridium paraputrificum]|uniref:hypothetical protein n=1 Tax=Clostridium paraputrificum TaxID=29363 RepID=UPI003D334A7C
MKKTKFIATILLINILANPLSVAAHGGRTDTQGGHKDNKNASGLGSYHYHHGQPAHLHTNGVCPYNGNSSSSSSNNSSTSQGSTKSTTTSPKVPVESESEKKAKVRASGLDTGYNDGYSGSSNKLGEYKSNYIADYKEGYAEGYKNGVSKRESEIKEAEKSGQALGNSDGYNNIVREEFDYSGNFKSEYDKAYKTAFKVGNDKLNNEINTESTKAFANGIRNEEFDSGLYSNTIIKEAAENGYFRGKNIYENYMIDVPVIGSKLNMFTEYSEGKDAMSFGLDNRDDNSFITISNKSKRKVLDFIFNMKSVNENGVNEGEAKLIVESFLSKDINDSYKSSKSYVRSDSNIRYEIEVLKVKKKKFRYMPRTMYVINKMENDKVVETSILSKEPKEVRKLKKTTKA